MSVRPPRRVLQCALVLLALTTSSLALAAPSQALLSSQTPQTLGLEEWFDYESVETGAGARAHVNLGTGNLVWHATPLINQGRGLSSFLNLTYNEQDVCDGILHNLIGDGPDYDYAGRNFSLGISAVTRLGEPLDVHKLLGIEIGNTVTLSDADGTRHTFTKLADGVNFSSPGGVNLHLRRFSDTDPGKRLAMTRPDGITHFFDIDGYESSIEDRNGNEIRFGYEEHKHGLLDLKPHKRVNKVIDSAGVLDWPQQSNRTVSIQYDDFDRVSNVIDHEGRSLRLSYDAQGLLTSMTEADASAVQRTTRFEYGGSSLNPDLVKVTDPRGGTTNFAHDTSSPQRVTSFSNRRNNVTRFAYAETDGGRRTTVTDPRGFNTTHELDAIGRPVKLTDPQGTVMALSWDGDNNPTRIVAAAGSPDEAATTMTYNANGLLTSSTDGENHRTELRYRDGAGTILNPIGTDGGRGFVSDLVAYTTPKGTATSTPGDFTETYAPDAKGNVLSRTNAAGFTAHTTYAARGQITSEKDEVGNVTLYRDFDANGLPREQVDPRGGVWHYRYDAVGNTLAIVDPRNPTATGTRFTTSLTYDALDRLTTERIPKDSTNNLFVTKRHEFDANSNQIATVDGTGARTEKTFTEMDDVYEHRSPATSHFGEPTPAPETSWLRYDEDDNLLRVTHPNGTASAFGGDFLTAYTYDEVGQRTAEIRRSRGDGPDVDLATSYAYDRRGNVVGVVDPKRNAQFGGDPAANAKLPARHRLSYRYDRADNRVFAAEDPAGLNLRRELRYDANDNKLAEVGPRGFAAGADPAKFTETLEYDPRDLLVASTDAKGRRAAYALRGDGKLVRETKPKGTASALAGDYETTFDYLPTGELKSWSLPEAPGQYAAGKGKVQYERDPVGNPTKITDARGKSFNSTFLDTGDVASTERPSWWSISPTAGSQGGPAVAEKSPDELMRGGDASGGTPREVEVREETSGDGGNVSGEPLPSLLPKAGLTRLGHDNELRLTSVTDVAGQIARVGYDPVGRTTSTEQPFADGRAAILQRFFYDRNGNLRQDRDGEDVATTYGYDQFDRRIRTTAAGTPDQPEELTLDTFDANGNVVARQLPRGASTTWRVGYDGVDRLVTRANAASETTSFGYDEAGNEVLERSPRGNVAGLTEAQREGFTTRSTYDEVDQRITRRDGLGHETRFGYDLNANQASVDAPGAKRAADAAEERRLTARTFDGRDLSWAQTTGSGEHERTSVREFDANGNLRREVNPAGVDPATKLPRTADGGDGAVAGTSTATKDATVREFSADNLLTSVHLPWGDRDAKDQRRYRQDFGLDGRGRVQSLDAPYEWTNPTAAKSTTAYTHYDTGWIRTSTDPDGKSPDTGETVPGQRLTYDYDRRGLQTLWQSSTNRQMVRAYFPNGKLQERKALVPAQGANPAHDRRYTYRYNANRSLITINDIQKSRVTRMDYDVAERKRYVDEEWANGKDTKFDYDANGNTVARRTDGELTGADRSGYAGGKLTNYVFDVLDRETRMTVDPAGGVGDRVATSEYWPGGELSRRVKSNGVQETWFFANDGRMLRDRRQGSGEMAKDQEYRYDANGNRAKDERGEHAFNARDQLVEWKRGEQYDAPGSRVTYDVNGSGAVDEERDEASNETTKYQYEGDRLLSSRVNDETPSAYHYDSFGSVKEIKGGPDAATFAYDEFERMTMSSGDPDGSGQKRSEYEYDGMDRRDTEKTDAGTQDFAYVGTTDQLSQERGRTGGKSEDYDYDSTEQLVGRAEGQNGAESQGSYNEYGIDANGSVEGLEGDDGVIKPGNQYQYDPYGKIENEKKLTDQPTKDNPFRFESFYYDSGVKQYDMRARNYRPEIGRFTSQDRFESASKDFNLQADPLTQNRYAFAGGNPVNRVEFDGHDIIEDIGLDNERDDAKDAVAEGAEKVKNEFDKKRDPKTEFGKGVIESVAEAGDALAHPRRTREGLRKAGESFANDPVGSTTKAASAVGKCFETNAARCAGKTAAGVIGGKGVGAAAKGAGAAAKGAKGAGAGAKGPGNRAGRAAGACNSFVPGTPVLMADGSSKAIEDVRVGDLVLATVEMTGQTAAFPVTDLIAGLGEKHLVRITADGRTTVATLKHPYYLPDEQRWIPAGSLSIGDRLRRADGSTIVVEAVSQFTVLGARVHNLTVAKAHTYYAGGEPVLVHNAKRKKGQTDADRRRAMPRTSTRQLGGNGLPRRHFVRHASKKEAKDAARHAGDGAPEQDAENKERRHPAHYHSTRKGDRVSGGREGGVHHTYGNNC